MLGVNSYFLSVLDYLGVAQSTLEEHCARTHYLNVTSLSLDSRVLNAQSVFIAVFGAQSAGHDYLASATTKKCQLALLETKIQADNGKLETKYYADKSIVCIYVHSLVKKLADIAFCFYTGKLASEQNTTHMLPSITAITGTNGKTSVATLIAQLTSLCKQKSASIGTLGVNLFTQGRQQKIAETINTTPDIVSLIGILASLKAQGCQHLTLEASSHGLVQKRLEKLNICCAVFTNLSQDHLDYHKSMAQYAKAKRQLLKANGVGVVVLNADDKESLQWQQEAKPAQTILWFSLHPLGPEQFGCWASDIAYETSGIKFTIHARFADYETTQTITAPLIGAFNVANLLASITALLGQGFLLGDLCKAASALTSVAGRMELFTGKGASVLVDYAHTPDALEQALRAARVHTQGRLCCIFGCGGNRDKSKRAIMGSIAQRFADDIILTQDNSRHEDPAAIIADIQAGITALNKQQTLRIELDRSDAISNALSTSQHHDMILVAGKGHENYIEINDQRIDYNEREVVTRLIAKNASHCDTSTAYNNNNKNKGGPL